MAQSCEVSSANARKAMAAFRGYGAKLSINLGSVAQPAWEELGKVRSAASIPPCSTGLAPNSTPPPGRIPEALIGATLAGLMLLLSLFIAMLSG